MKLSHLLNRTSNLAFWSSLFQNCNHLSKQNGMSERMHVYLIYLFRLTLPESTAMFSMIWSSLQLMDHARAEEAKRQHQEDKSDQLEVILSFEFDFAFNFAMNRDTFYSRSKILWFYFLNFYSCLFSRELLSFESSKRVLNWETSLCVEIRFLN